MADLPIACTLDPEARETRRQGLLPQLVRGAERLEARTDGFRLHFTPSRDVLALITRVIDAERRCCRFLRFGLTVEPDEGPVVLELAGPPGTREFLEALFEADDRGPARQA